jgi:flagellar motor switch protein FliM
MNLCIPYNVIEPVIDQLSTQSWFSVNRQSRNTEQQKRIDMSIGRASVRVCGVLARTSMTVSDLLTLAPGDLIMTEKPAIEPVTIQVENETKYWASIGQVRGSRALRIIADHRTGQKPPRAKRAGPATSA